MPQTVFTQPPVQDRKSLLPRNWYALSEISVNVRAQGPGSAGALGPTA